MKYSYRHIIAKLTFLTIFWGFLSCEETTTEKEEMVLIQATGNIHSFWMDVSPVTVAQFRTFVLSTHYQTQADKFGDAGVFEFKTGDWGLVKGANWEYPYGKQAPKAKPNHPVTQVSWNDAIAYCKWAKKRLPTSEEFLLAQKNGNPNNDQTYTWGKDYKEGNKFKANFWQGSFPSKNTVEDGFLTTSPVGYFGKNKINLVDIEGNVWQWCSDDSKEKPEEKYQRGGSFLCDPMVCHGFKTGGISSSSAETSLCHTGFRGVKNAD